MRSLRWSTSHAVFVTEIDDEHKAIFEAVSQVKASLGSGGPAELSQALKRLVSCVADHFAHEERLMRAARYESLRWHKTAHDNARRRVTRFVQRIEQGDTWAGVELIEYRSSWLDS